MSCTFGGYSFPHAALSVVNQLDFSDGHAGVSSSRVLPKTPPVAWLQMYLMVHISTAGGQFCRELVLAEMETQGRSPLFFLSSLSLSLGFPLAERNREPGSTGS